MHFNRFTPVNPIISPQRGPATDKIAKPGLRLLPVDRPQEPKLASLLDLVKCTLAYA